MVIWSLELYVSGQAKVLETYIPMDNLSPGRTFLSLVPTDSMEEFYLPLTAFDFSANSKNGCRDCPKMVWDRQLNH